MSPLRCTLLDDIVTVQNISEIRNSFRPFLRTKKSQDTKSVDSGGWSNFAQEHYHDEGSDYLFKVCDTFYDQHCDALSPHGSKICLRRVASFATQVCYKDAYNKQIRRRQDTTHLLQRLYDTACSSLKRHFVSDQHNTWKMGNNPTFNIIFVQILEKYGVL